MAAARVAAVLPLARVDFDLLHGGVLGPGELFEPVFEVAGHVCLSLCSLCSLCAYTGREMKELIKPDAGTARADMLGPCSLSGTRSGPIM